MYLLHYIYEFLLLPKIDNKWCDMCFGAMIAIGFALLSRIMPSNVSNLLSWSYMATLYPYFYLGVMVKKYNLQKLLLNNNIVMAISVITCLIFITKQSIFVSWTISYKLFSLAMIICCLNPLYSIMSGGGK